MKEASAGVLDPSSATRNIVKSSRGKTSPIIKDPVARSVSEQVQRVERIQTADGPALVFIFSRNGKTYRVIQTRDRTMELKGSSPVLGRFSPSPSRFWDGRHWTPPSGAMTVAVFPASFR
jgi:hypothetical protein